MKHHGQRQNGVFLVEFGNGHFELVDNALGVAVNVVSVAVSRRLVEIEIDPDPGSWGDLRPRVEMRGQMVSAVVSLPRARLELLRLP